MLLKLDRIAQVKLSSNQNENTVFLTYCEEQNKNVHYSYLVDLENVLQIKTLLQYIVLG